MYSIDCTKYILFFSLYVNGYSTGNILPIIKCLYDILLILRSRLTNDLDRYDRAKAYIIYIVDVSVF